MTYRLASLIALPALLLAGCASTPLTNRDSGALEQEVRDLKTRVVELQRKSAVNEVEMERLRQQIATLEGRGGAARPASPPAATPSSGSSSSGTFSRPAPSASGSGAGTSSPPAPSNPDAPVVPVDRDLPMPRIAPAPAIEESDIDIPEPSPQPPARRVTTPASPAPATAAPTSRGNSSGASGASGTPAPTATAPRAGIYTPPSSTRPSAPPPPSSTGSASPYRGGPVASTAPATPPPAPPAASGTSASSATPAPEPGSPAAQALYDRGYTLYNQGHYVDAEASFQRFLQGNPENELADNAQYWIGECRYARGDLRGALDAFRQTVERYPTGNKVPDALLKAGQSLESLGNVDDARTTYAEVIRRYSGSAAAAVAEERRTKLN